MYKLYKFRRLSLVLIVLLNCAAATAGLAAEIPANYVLGPEDQVVIRVIELDDIGDKPVRVDASGNIDLPLLGPVHAAGLTVSQFREHLTEMLRQFLHNPVVSVSVSELHSQPVTVVGAVNSPGVRQVEGPRTLLEIISLAGGLRPDAGSRVTVTRTKESGALPIPGARTTLEGTSVAELDLTGLLASKNPAENIQVRANDVITVSTAELIYVLGEVKKPGGFTLHSNESVSVLQALALAEGMQTTAAPRRARILRMNDDKKARTELPVDLSEIIRGKSPDAALRANDILVIPDNMARNVALRGLQTAIQLGTGILIFHR